MFRNAVAALLMLVCILCLTSGTQAELINGGFENRENGWDIQYESTHGDMAGYFYSLSAVYSGTWGLLVSGVAQGQPGAYSTLRMWNRYMDLTDTAAISFYGMGFGGGSRYDRGEANFSLDISDGTNTASVMIYDAMIDTVLLPVTIHEAPHSPWYRFVAPLNESTFGPGFENIDLTNARIGFRWHALYNNPAGYGWMTVSGSMDEVSLIPVPEPSSLLAMFGGIGSLAGVAMRRRRR